jgi:thiol:disulfide interchange protein
MVGLVVALAACGGAPAPTPTVVPTPDDLFVEGELITMTPPPGRMVDQPNYTVSDVALVGKTGRPQVVVFIAGNCDPCQQMRPVVFAAQDEFGAFIDFLYLDAEADATRSVRDALKVAGERPTILFIDGAGQEVGRLTGVQTAERFQEVLDTILTVG